jgi:hypothetical protein
VSGTEQGCSLTNSAATRFFGVGNAPTVISASSEAHEANVFWRGWKASK